jgi:hypothetical protein
VGKILPPAEEDLRSPRRDGTTPLIQSWKSLQLYRAHFTGSLDNNPLKSLGISYLFCQGTAFWYP